MMNATQENHSNTQPQVPKTPLDTLAAMAHATFPGSKVIVLVESAGSFQMAGVNLTSASERMGMLAAAQLLSRHEFASGINQLPPAVVQNETKSNT